MIVPTTNERMGERMYFCRVCENAKTFTEHNLIETELHIDEETGKVIGSHDSFLECTEVVCGVCKATSKNGDVVNKKGDQHEL